MNTLGTSTRPSGAGSTVRAGRVSRPSSASVSLPPDQRSRGCRSLNKVRAPPLASAQPHRPVQLGLRVELGPRPAGPGQVDRRRARIGEDLHRHDGLHQRRGREAGRGEVGHVHVERQLHVPMVAHQARSRRRCSHALNCGGRPGGAPIVTGMTGMTGINGSTAARGLGAAYWRLWWANAVSTVGDGAFAAALPLLAVAITRDPELISVVAAATYLPWLLVSPPAGVLVDRYDRVALMWRSQLVQCAVVAAVAILVAVRAVDIAVLAASGFLLGSAQVVFTNAAQSVLPQLRRASGNQYVVQTVGQSFAGPPLGSVMFAAVKALPFCLDAVSFAGSALLLARLPTRHPAAAAGAGAAPGGMLDRIGSGLRWLRGHRLLRIVALLLGVNNFCAQMGQATLVLFATQTLHLGARGYRLLLAASAAGSVAGGGLNHVVTRRLGEGWSLILASGINALLSVCIGLAPGTVMAGALLAASGFAVTMRNVVTVTMRQRIVPDEMLGRVNSTYRMLGWGMIPLGALAGGLVAQAAGQRAPWILAGSLRGLALIAVAPALIAGARSVSSGRAAAAE